jgi:PASTA domain
MVLHCPVNKNRWRFSRLSPRISFITVLKRLLTLAVLVMAFFLSAILVIYFAYGGREVKVPELAGKSQTEAQGELSGLGLRMRVTTSAPSEKVAADQISEQEPKPGVTVKTGQSVRVILSSGPPATPSPTPKATPKPTLPEKTETAGKKSAKKSDTRNSKDPKKNKKPDKPDAKKPSDKSSGKTEKRKTDTEGTRPRN